MNNQMLGQQEQIQQSYPYSVRIEQTAKGARVSVHCYSQLLEVAVKETLEAYQKTRKELLDAGFKVAQEE